MTKIARIQNPTPPMWDYKNGLTTTATRPWRTLTLPAGRFPIMSLDFTWFASLSVGVVWFRRFRKQNKDREWRWIKGLEHTADPVVSLAALLLEVNNVGGDYLFHI